MPGSEAIDRSIPHAARIYDYLAGGPSHFEVDRAAAAVAFAGVPGGLEGAKAQIQSNRHFLRRAVEYLAGENGIRQFLDIGTGIPGAGNVHGVAQGISPDARTVYVDNDPSVLAHAHELLEDDGTATFIDGDLRRPAKILREATGLLDFDRPVAVMLIAVLHFVEDDDHPYEIVRQLLDAVPSGSFLAISHVSINGVPEYGPDLVRATVDHLNEHASEVMVPRELDELERFFEGLEMVEPGLVPVHRWRPGTDDLLPLPNVGGVARKP
jgi:hypothetical protein